MTSSTVFIVVGNVFETFLGHTGTVSAAEFTSLLESGKVPPGSRVLLGQGLSMWERQHLNHRVTLHGRGVQVAAGASRPSADRALTHKHHPANIMITPPVRRSDDTFEADLVIDAGNEVMSDHVTGQHIPGLALTEAARQMWTAVTEAHLLPAAAAGSRFVIHSMSQEFSRYVFPLPAQVRYTLLTQQPDPRGYAFRCRVDVVQDDALTARVESRYQVVDERVSAKQEAMAARQALADLRRRHEVGTAADQGLLAV